MDVTYIAFWRLRWFILTNGTIHWFGISSNKQVVKKGEAAKKKPDGIQEPVVQTPISLIHRLNFFNPPTEVG